MKRRLTRCMFGVLIVMIAATSVVFCSQPAPQNASSDQSLAMVAGPAQSELAAAMYQQADSSSLSFATWCVLLAGGMFFLFRPKRRVQI